MDKELFWTSIVFLSVFIFLGYFACIETQRENIQKKQIKSICFTECAGSYSCMNDCYEWQNK